MQTRGRERSSVRERDSWILRELRANSCYGIRGCRGGRSQFAWSHWEQGEEGSQAIFRYAIPRDTSPFEVGFCCLADPDGTILFKTSAAYQGEIAIDPDSGAIRRLTVDRKTGATIADAEFRHHGRVRSCCDRGKNLYLPDKKRLHFKAAHSKAAAGMGETFGVYGRFETILNDMAFEKYHIFRAESRILPGYTPPPKEK